MPSDNKDAGEWFSDDGFWTAYAALLFDERRWAETPAAVDALLGLSGLAREPGAAVLDMCCGPGRHALELARRGYTVTGVDITKPYLEAARESAEAEGLSASFVHGDARNYEGTGSYKLALNLYTSFGYFDDPQDDFSMVKNLFRNLAPGGCLVMDMVGKETAVRDFIEGEWFERDGKLILTEFSVVGAWEGLKNRWVIQDGARRVDRSWVQRLYAGTELRSLLLSAGFTKVEIFGSLDGIPYDRNAKSLVALAIK